MQLIDMRVIYAFFIRLRDGSGNLTIYINFLTSLDSAVLVT